jgi:hypothetical protein
LEGFAGYFLEWCLAEGIFHWEILLEKRSPIEYVRFLATKGLKRKTIIHYLDPIKRASRWVKTKGNHDWFEGFVLDKRVGVDLKYHNQKRLTHIPLTKVLELLAWLPGYHFESSLRPGIALQGIVGLQLLEALRLTWDRWDRVNRTITIEEDRRNDPDTAGVKNPWRVRRLPIPEIVNEILIETYERRGRPEGSELVVDVPSWKAYCNRIYRMLKQFDPTIKIPPSDLRNTLSTAAEDGNWMSVWFRRYFGHAPATTIERHYLGVQAAGGCEEGSDAFVKKLREEVLVHLDREICNLAEMARPIGDSC